MALNLDISKEEIKTWVMSEEEMAEQFIKMDLINETAYRKYKEEKDNGSEEERD